jgi:hypothetical protein
VKSEFAEFIVRVPVFSALLPQAACHGSAMKTATGFVVRNPLELLIGFVRHWYPMYDGVQVPQDNSLRVTEIALSTMISSRISGNTGGAIWRDARCAVEKALAEIPHEVDLLDIPEGEAIPGEEGMSCAISAMCDITRCKLSVATKILHKKRPGLIPIFDSVVEGLYWPTWCPSVKDRAWGDYAVELTRWVHKDMLSVSSELRKLRDRMQKNRTPMTGCRILNVLMWAVRSENEDWLRELGKGAPFSST